MAGVWGESEARLSRCPCRDVCKVGGRKEGRQGRQPRGPATPETGLHLVPCGGRVPIRASESRAKPFQGDTSQPSAREADPASLGTILCKVPQMP